MGNLVTKGRASNEYDAEIMKLTVIFQKKGQDAGYVLKSAKEQCESFLSELNNINVPPEKIQLIDGGVLKKYGHEETTAEKRLIVETRIDIELCTYIFSLIEKCKDEIQYDISFDLLEKEIKSNELLKLAVEDSRRQANIIAASLGKSVIGVNSVNDQKYNQRSLAKSLTIEDAIKAKIPDAFKSDTPLSDRAALPKVLMSEDIEITWNMSE